MLLGNLNRCNYSLQKIDYTLSFFLNAIAFSYHQGKCTVSLIREFWDSLYMYEHTSRQTKIGHSL
jgi:hypothetical protein